MFAYFTDTLPHFLAYFGAAIRSQLAFFAIYVMITPHQEFALIRERQYSAAAPSSSARSSASRPGGGGDRPFGEHSRHAVVGRRRGYRPAGGLLRHLAAAVHGRSRTGSPMVASPRASSSAASGWGSAFSRPPAWSPDSRLDRSSRMKKQLSMTTAMAAALLALPACSSNDGWNEDVVADRDTAVCVNQQGSGSTTTYAASDCRPSWRRQRLGTAFLWYYLGRNSRRSLLRRFDPRPRVTPARAGPAPSRRSPESIMRAPPASTG